MKKFFIFFWYSSLFLSTVLVAQNVESLGLQNLHLTTLKVGEGRVAVGTHGNGVYWRMLGETNDSTWHAINVKGVNVKTVYPHKSGPIGWALGIGAEPNQEHPDYILCSYLGADSVRNMGYGIDTNQTPAIVKIDGFPDPTVCGETFAIGGRKLYRRYFNDSTWETIYPLSVEGDFASLKAREESAFVYAGGGEGFAGMLLIRSSDTGNNWEVLSPMCRVTDLDFWGTTNHKIFVTDNMVIKSSLDNGTNWKSVFSNDSLYIKNIAFSRDGKKVVATANSRFYDLPRSYLLVTTDDGESWITEQLPIYDILVGLDFDYDDYPLVAAISEGVFRIKSPVVGTDDNSLSELPNRFLLKQNFPNPFNPETTIRYSIPSGSTSNETGKKVLLSVYDVMGRKISTLVNEVQSSGEYEVKFSGENLPSGIYFVYLQSEENFKSIKMLLIK